MLAPPRSPAPSFRLVRYFSVASLIVFLPVAATLLYFDHQKNDFFKRVQQQQDAIFAQMQDSFVQRHAAAAPAYLLTVYEASNVNLARMFANTLWDRDFAPMVARAQSITVDQCRAIADVKDAGGRTVPPPEKEACYAEIGRQIMALPEFQALDAKVFETVKKSTVLKFKVFDLRGITVYSSEHKQIGEDHLGNAGWNSAIAGKPASQLTHRGKFSAFEGEVANRDLISSYLPVMVHGSEKTVAVFEVYSDVTQFLEQIDATSAQIRKLSVENRALLERGAAANQDKVDANANLLLAIVLGLLALLYCALFLIVRSGQRIIDKQDLERKRAGLALARQKDLYEMLSQTNQVIIRVTNREELFPAVCRVAVEHGHFRFAWVGLIGDEDRRMQPVARYGEDAGYLDQVVISADEADAAGHGPAGQALRTGEHVLSNDFLVDPATAPWHEAALRAGVRASAALPIRQGGAVVGTINLYAGESGFFSEAVLATLDEMAIDVSYALGHFAHEAARNRLETTLREGEARYRQLFDANPHPMWFFDPETLAFLAVNDAAVAHYGWSREEFLAMTIADIRPAEDVPALLGHLAANNKEAIRNVDSSRHRKKDGTLIDVEISSHSIDFGGRRARVAAARDITERRHAEEALRAAEEQFRGLVEQSIAGIYIIQDGVFAYVNPRFAEIRGYGSADEVIGRDPLQLIAEKDRDSVAENNRRLLAGEMPSINYSFIALRKDGSGVEVGGHSALATYRGRPAIIGLLQDISEKKRAEEQIEHYIAQLENVFMQSVELATTLGEMRDPYTAGHERRVAQIAVAIGTELGFDARRQEGLQVAGYLHDIGKITVPSEILSKPGKLSALEYQLVQGHTRAGYEVLKGLQFPWPVAEVALQHHERIDGSGYPQGLRGEAILFEARIIAVADVVEAMSSHRPYRPALGIEFALAEIERGRGTLYDAAAADVCLRLFREKGYRLPE